MFSHEKKSLERIASRLREAYGKKIAEMYAFGSRVRGDFGPASDFDLLVVVQKRDPALEKGIINIIVEEETKSGLNFSPVIKDFKTFEQERNHNTPFYESLQKEGALL